MKTRRRPGETPQLNMTPMIDVVFQLMIFFLVVLKDEDLLSHLDVSRPRSVEQPGEPPLLNVTVMDSGFVLQGRRIDLAELERQAGKVASFDREVSVVIKCTSQSPHSFLIQALDVFAKHRMSNVAVFSL